MLAFLQTVAKAYTGRYEDLSEICFVFPNKRSGTFFQKYLKEEREKHVMLSPEITTISGFVAQLSGRVVAGRLDLLFLLYEAYREILGQQAEEIDESEGQEFESFRGWGETVISDFSEVDQYQVSVEAIFKNVKDYREIASNFLTEEQKSVLAEYFGRTDTGDSTRFWKNFDKEDEALSTLKRRFLHLWRIMAPLYERFNEKLRQRGLSTSGGAYRLAAEVLQKGGREQLPYKKIVFVGFNALSTSENSIFKELRDFKGYEGFDEYADFFWDMTGPVMTEDSVNSASKFVKANIKMFPCPEWAKSTLKLSDAEKMPKINIVASPSNSAQTKIAGNLLAELRGRITSKEITGAKVAVVLPDENLLLPMLYSLPEGMGDVNLTMGYPMRLTSVVPFVSLLRKLWFNMRKSGESVAYYHRDLRLFLAHPFSLATFGERSVRDIIKVLNKEHRAVMSLEEIGAISEELGKILNPESLGNSPKEILDYVEEVLGYVKERLLQNRDVPLKEKLETSHIDIYIDSLRRLRDIFDEYRVRLKRETVFYLTDRLLAGENVRFKGEPLTGLQVMGTLETRSIDFEHLFILSMNERIMPMRMRNRTFIPNSLRRAYGMPPSNYAENIFAYYFYRMISRAKEVTLIYDARNGAGQGGGDVSRYIVQLRHLFAKGKINEQEWKFVLSKKKEYDASIEKTPEIIKLLEGYEEEGGKKRFSASALNDYRECQARFYYRQVLNLNTDPEPSEFIDAIGVGNILHSLMEEVYVPKDKRGQLLDEPLLITTETIDSILSRKEVLRKNLTRIINRLHFSKKEDQQDTPLSGAAAIVAERILEMGINVMRHDRALAPFHIYGTEIKEVLRIPLKVGRTINFTFAIDRLDEIMEEGEWRMRIVDYKTGSIKLEASDFEEIFSGDYKSEQIFQLFTYSWLLGKAGVKRSENVITEIYDVPKIFRGERKFPKIDKIEVRGYEEYSEIFSKKMEEMLESVFLDKEFKATEDETRCAMCGFKAFCRR